MCDNDSNCDVANDIWPLRFVQGVSNSFKFLINYSRGYVKCKETFRKKKLETNREELAKIIIGTYVEFTKFRKNVNRHANDMIVTCETS